MPSTAQPSCGRPSARIPATLRPPSRTSLGHLIAASRRRRRPPPRPRSRAPAAAARRAARATRSSARPGGALHVRPWRPRPARCSPAVTSVPCGAPAIASARARSLVESVARRCSRGAPSRAAAHAVARDLHAAVDLQAERVERRAAVDRQRRARRSCPRRAAAPPGATSANVVACAARTPLTMTARRRPQPARVEVLARRRRA